MAEDRIARRQKTLLHGLVYFDGSPIAVECTVREMSDDGARLVFERPPAPVEAFELDIPLRGQKRRVTVQWQQGNDLGVAFAGPGAQVVVSPPVAPAQVTTADLALRVRQLETELAAMQRVVKQLQHKLASQSESA